MSVGGEGMRLHVWLEQARRADGSRWTQASFGAAVGVTQQVISRWADGKAIPRRHSMTAILRITGGDVTEADFYAQANEYAQANAGGGAGAQSAA